MKALGSRNGLASIVPEFPNLALLAGIMVFGMVMARAFRRRRDGRIVAVPSDINALVLYFDVDRGTMTYRQKRRVTAVTHEVGQIALKEGNGPDEATRRARK